MNRRTELLAAIAFCSVFSAVHAHAGPPKVDNGSVKTHERQLRDLSPQEQEQLEKATKEKRKQPHPFKIGDVAPRLRVASWTDGEKHSLEDFRGKVVVLEFTASWCVPCRSSAPIMQSLAAKYGDRVAWVGVTSSEATDDELKQWLGKDKWPPIVGVDETDREHEFGATAKDYGVIGVPQLVVIDPYGKISHCDELMSRTPPSDEEAEKLYAAASKFLGRKWPPSASEKLSTEEFNIITKKLEEFRTAKYIDEALAKKTTALDQADKLPTAYLTVPTGRMPPLDRAMELEVFALKLRSIAPKDWIVERKDRAFRLRGPEVPAGQERAQILLWFDDVSISSDNLSKRDKSLPKIGALNNTRLGRHYFNRNNAAENLWPEFGFEVRLIEPTDQIAIAGTGVHESEVIGLAWFDAAFVRYVEIRPDGRRWDDLLRLDGSAIGITPATKFLVVGELPDPARATTDAAKQSAMRHRETLNELKAEAMQHGVRTISLADFESYAKSVVKKGRGFRTRWIKDANQLQVPECLMTGRGLVEVKLVEPK